jgi:hypothetical protein
VSNQDVGSGEVDQFARRRVTLVLRGPFELAEVDAGGQLGTRPRSPVGRPIQKLVVCFDAREGPLAELVHRERDRFEQGLFSFAIEVESDSGVCVEPFGIARLTRAGT